ncbi:MAG: glycosyltransferase [Ruminiclostridium sp.]|nr:glycosyltransferase [Ruminiclostridium sp.]
MSQYTPKVSIIIPAYNASNYLAEAIDSALAQTYENIEIIVVNDGSKDDGATRRVAASYGDKIRYFEKENGGSSSALNRGIREMTGEWFSWLSHDDLYYPNKVERQIAAIRQLDLPEEERSKLVFFSASDLIDGTGKYIRKADMDSAWETARFISALPGNEYLIAEPTRFTFHGCSCFIHRDAFVEVGAFDEDLRLVNDVDLWFRLYAAGYVVHYLPEALVMGRVHAKQVSRSIGFSYHNPEQDMFWARSLKWLETNHPENYELFYAFGRNAYLKTRDREGDRAFARAEALRPELRVMLWRKKKSYQLYAGGRTMLKKVYMKFRM